MQKKVYKIGIILSILIAIGVSCSMMMKMVKASDEMPNSNQTKTQEEMQNNTQQTSANQTENNNNGLGLIAAALATGLSCIGAGIAVALVASSAVGAISENPKLLGKTIIFAGLAEGIAIYGLIISIMILNKV